MPLDPTTVQRAFPSPEARRFIDETPANPTGSLTTENIGLLREEIRAGFAPASHQAVARHDVRFADVTIDGLSFMEVTPKGMATDIILFYCFGGGMITGSPFEDLPITAALARQANATIYCPYYRLAPEHPFPAARDDVLAAYRAVAARHDRQRMAMVGESAGGNLVLGLLQSLAPGERPRALALMSPWCDLTQQGDSLRFNAGRDPTLKPDDLRRCAEAYATHHDRQAAALSPLFGTFDPAMPPAIITTGSRDLLMSDSIRLATVMQQAGMMAELRIGEGLWHVFEFYDIPEAHRSLQRIADFLRQSIEKA